MKRQSPKGFGTAFAKAKGAGKDTFEFEGKTYRTQGGYNYAKPIGEAKAEKPKKSTSEKPKKTENKSKSSPERTRYAESSTGGPARYRQPSPPKKVNAGASNPPTQSSTQSLPTGSGVTRTTGSQADRSPRRASPQRPSQPIRESEVSTKQSRYKPMVRKADIQTFAQWKALSREQRKQAGLPLSQIGARAYFAGKK